MFKKILTTSDSVDVCDAPSAVAAHLAKQEGAGLCLMHVLESSDLIRRQWVKDFRTGEDVAVTAEYIDVVKGMIKKKCAESLIGCKDYVIEVRPGFPWLEILRMARATRADLMVLGPHRGKAEEKGVVRMRTVEGLGSTVEAVIMRAHCPVMIVSRDVPKEKLAFKRILFGTDFSETCQYAFELSLKAAQKYNSRLHILHVLRIPRGERVAYTPAQIEREIAGVKEKVQKVYAKQIKGTDYACDVLEGEPSAEILKYATSNQIDLIVVGSHVREQAERWYVGSVVEKLGSESYCPLITVTRPEALLKLEE
ncbi:MAG: universal stress protein [Desulfovibrionales bacterium]|nr:universal stress protein [Desulfovibrionales bacterium]